MENSTTQNTITCRPSSPLEEATVKNYLTVQTEARGKRTLTRCAKLAEVKAFAAAL